jgi:hypothetical protein
LNGNFYHFGGFGAMIPQSLSTIRALRVESGVLPNPDAPTRWTNFGHSGRAQTIPLRSELRYAGRNKKP